MREVRAAIVDLRELARGRSAVCPRQGLAAALTELAARTPVPVDLDVSPDRYPAEIEATAYFVASEALTNAVKYARAQAIQVHTRRHDNGTVRAVQRRRRGRRRSARRFRSAGLLDRVAAHGGDLSLASPDGAGTTVTVGLPCAS